MTWSPIVELRQYQLHPERRDDLISLFERNFVESQEEEGMAVIGTFRDLDDDDRFVWIRGFPSMSDRRRGLEAFYYGSVWRANRDQANETMVDSDNVLLLRPARKNLGFRPAANRPPVGAPERDRGIVQIDVLLFDAPPDDATIDDFHEVASTSLKGSAGRLLGCLVTEEAENDFPALPVREGEHALVCLLGYPDEAAFDSAQDARAEIRREAERLPGVHAVDELRLAPTARSQLAGDSLASVEPNSDPERMNVSGASD